MWLLTKFFIENLTKNEEAAVKYVMTRPINKGWKYHSA